MLSKFIQQIIVKSCQSKQTKLESAKNAGNLTSPLDLAVHQHTHIHKCVCKNVCLYVKIYLCTYKCISACVQLNCVRSFGFSVNVANERKLRNLYFVDLMKSTALRQLLCVFVYEGKMVKWNNL